MKVCIDGIGTTKLKSTGLYSYTYEYLRNLLDIYPQPSYHLIWEEHSLKDIKPANNLTYIDLPLNRRENDYKNLEEYILENNINIYHAPNNGFSLPSKKRCRYISTIHDLSPLYHKQFVDEGYEKKFFQVLPNVIQNSDQIITVSQFLKSELLEYYQVPEDRIKVIYPGCAAQFYPKNISECRELLKKKYNVEQPYILYVGSIHRRKNLSLLFKVYREITKSMKDLKLVIAGSCEGKRYEHFVYLKLLANRLQISDNIQFIGQVDYHDMPYLYSGAVTALFLSEYEGFPLTSIEAMACGTPVICSEAAAFKEVVGEGGILVDPRDTAYIKEVILEIIYNPSFREHVTSRGRKQSMRYAWKEAVLQHVQIYEAFYNV